MARNQQKASTHFGTTHKLVRNVNVITQSLPKDERTGPNAYAQEKQEFESINMAKRFMLRGHLKAA